jgi:hypothetical protein
MTPIPVASEPVLVAWSTDELADQALQFCRHVVVQVGVSLRRRYSPPQALAQGERRSLCGCAIAKTISDATGLMCSVAPRSVQVGRADSDPLGFSTPEPVRHFMALFDQGAYPDLINTNNEE